MPICDQIRLSADALGVLQKGDLHGCKPRMLYFPRLACDEQTVNCVLFPKDLFQREQRRLRELVATRPGTPSERIRWMRRLAELSHWALDHTNIAPVWLLGGNAPIDVPHEPQNNQHIATLDVGLWPRASESVWSLTRYAAKYAVPPQGVVRWPLSTPSTYDPYYPDVDTWGYIRLPATAPALFMFHDPADFTTVVSAGLRGLGILEAHGAPRTPQLKGALLSSQVRDALRADGVDINKVYSTTEWPAMRDRALAKHLAIHNGGGLVPVHALDANNRPIKWAVAPAADGLLNYYAAVATDIVETPYEVFVLWGIEKWAANLEVWAQRGRINISPERIVSVAREVSTARGRIFAAGGFSIAAGIGTLINPIAGAVLAALGTLADLVFKEAGAIGQWNCPFPLTRRSAAGDCDFGTVIGPDALERAQRQQAGTTAVFQSRLTPPAPAPPAATRAGVPPLLLVAGGLAVAAGLGYYLLKE